LRQWSRDLRLATGLILAATVMSYFLPGVPKEYFINNAVWFFIHPLWGLGFFIVINRLVLAEQSWIRRTTVPAAISIFATLGIFSYSIYLVHELVIMQSWRWTNPAWLQSTNVLLVVLPATILFSWVFFWFCERPFMVRKKTETADRRTHWQPIVESQPSMVSD
ncbi:MAG TPA: acyltransferase family protein, partial [Pyrinomonadaceae bacterium]|nr:acyltransferase family protein [Pyrinomonadaceae bacterium]